MGDKFDKVRKLMLDRNMLIQSRDLAYGFNKLRKHSNRKESFLHWMGKSGLGYLIGRKKEPFLTEHQFPSGDIVDVLQVKLKLKEFISYQVIHTHANKKQTIPCDVIPVDMNKLPEDIKEGLEKFRKWLNRYVV